jgi:ABC-type branched-subunit amino acid transport system permease subunit
MSELDASLKFLEGGRYILFGLAVVLIMMWRPQGVVTRTMLENLRASWGGRRARAETSAGGRA